MRLCACAFEQICYGMGQKYLGVYRRLRSSEGLVAQQDHRGFTVAPLSEADLDSLTNARCWLNGVGLRQSIARGAMEWEEALVVSFHRLRRIPQYLDGASNTANPAWDAAHRDFHYRLISPSGSDWLERFCEQLFEAATRYRNVARIASSARPPVEKEHESIMVATLDRNVELAVELLREHFVTTANRVGEVLATRRANEARE